MTVKKLIEKLGNYPEHAEVYFRDVETNSAANALLLNGIFFPNEFDGNEGSLDTVNILLTETEEI